MKLIIPQYGYTYVYRYMHPWNMIISPGGKAGLAVMFQSRPR